MATESTSPTLLQRARERIPEAWTALVHLYGPMVYTWARRSGLGEADAADIVQETFQSVAVSLDGFRRESAGDSFRGWLWTITRNNVRDHFRARADEPVALGGSVGQPGPIELAAESPDVERGDVDRMLLRAVDLLRNGVAEPTWQAFVRVAVEGDRPADVAEDLGLSVASVYQAKSRMLRRLRREFGDVVEVPVSPGQIGNP